MDSQSSHLCPECGKPVPAGSPHQLCPSCLMAQALASRTLVDDDDAAAIPPPLSPEEIAEKFPQFEITECLGRGGMGSVYKARQKSLDRWVAIKILAPEREGRERFAERFAREAQTLARLSHPHIVTIHDFGQTDGLFYLVMEYVDGVNLRELLRDGKIEPAQALAIVPPICDALQYAHEKGIVHRDIKPENLLLDRDGRVKIADFGIASLIGAENESAGTPAYMAPEQADAKREVDHRADIYALGVVLYEMLTGERPGKEVIAPSRKVQIDVRLDEIVLRALEKKPELRFQNATLFKTQVETIAETDGENVNTGEECEVPPVSARTPFKRKLARFVQAFASAFGTLWLIPIVCGIVARTYFNFGTIGVFGLPVLSGIYAAWRVRPSAKPLSRARRFFEWYTSLFGIVFLLSYAIALTTLSRFNIRGLGLVGLAAASLVYAFWRDRRAYRSSSGDPSENRRAVVVVKGALVLVAAGLVASYFIGFSLHRAPKDAHFTPQTERTLAASPTGENRFIDFDTGTVLSLPPSIAAQLGKDDASWMLEGRKKAPNEYEDWIVQNGVDALALSNGIAIFNRACSAGHGLSDTEARGNLMHWDAIQPTEAFRAADTLEREYDRARRAFTGFGPPPVNISYVINGLTTANRHFPNSSASVVTSERLTGIEDHGTVWIFKTRQGARGAFVFEETKDFPTPSEKRIRYKLVEPGAGEKSQNSAEHARPSTTFGAAVEREIPPTKDDVHELTFFSLARGEVVKPPFPVKFTTTIWGNLPQEGFSFIEITPQLKAWAKEQKVDLVFAFEPNSWHWQTLETRIRDGFNEIGSVAAALCGEVTPERSFDSIGPAEAIDAFSRPPRFWNDPQKDEALDKAYVPHVASFWSYPKADNDAWSRTFDIFETRTGQVGIMGIMARPAGKGVKLRYKWVQETGASLATPKREPARSPVAEERYSLKVQFGEGPDDPVLTTDVELGVAFSDIKTVGKRVLSIDGQIDPPTDGLYRGQLRYLDVDSSKNLSVQKSGCELALKPGIPFRFVTVNGIARFCIVTLIHKQPDDGTRASQSWDPWAESIKNGEMRRLNGDLAVALEYYQSSLVAAGKTKQDWLRHRRLAESHLKTGDILSALGDLAGALDHYRSSVAAREEQAKESPQDPDVKKQLTWTWVKLGDVQKAQGDLKGALTSYRGGQEGEARYRQGFDALPIADKPNEPFKPEELTRLAANWENPRDIGRLMHLINLAGAEKDASFRFLLNKPELRKNAGIELSLLGYDYSVNGNKEALESLLAKLAQQEVGGDSGVVDTLSFIDEWDRSIKAVNAHFTVSDGAGGIVQGLFWLSRAYLFPRQMLEFKGEAGEGAPLKTTVARPQSDPVLLSIKADGTVILAGEPCPEEKLQERLAELGAKNPDTPVTLRADKSVPYSRVVAILEICQRANLRNVSFATQTATD